MEYIRKVSGNFNEDDCLMDHQFITVIRAGTYFPISERLFDECKSCNSFLTKICSGIEKEKK